jgi:O-antigen/teichoic acid export membrane protein
MISKEIKFLLTHSSIYGIGTIVSQLVAFLMLPVYTRYLTPKDYGVLELINITTSILGIVITIGIARALSRYYYEYDNIQEQNKVVSTTYLTYSIIALSCVLLLLTLTGFFATLILDSSIYAHYFKINFINLALGGLIDIGLMYLRITKKPVIYVSITITRLILLLSLNILFIVFLKKGVLGIFYSTLITRVIFAAAMTAAILLKTKLRFSLSLSIDMLKFSLPLIPATLANTLINQSDKYFVRYFFTIADTGIYSLARKLGNTIHLLLTMPFMMTYMPRRFEIMNKPDAQQIYSRVFKYYCAITIFAGLGISMLVPEILTIMATPQFYAAGKYVPLIVLSMIIFGFKYHFEFGILWSKKTKYYAYINIITAILNLITNIILIPRYGLWGGVWSSMIVLTIHSFSIYFVSQRLYPIQFDFKNIFKLFLIAFIFYYVSQYVSTDHLILNTMIKSMLFIIFPIAVISAAVFSTQELNGLKNILNQAAIKYIFLKTPVRFVNSLIK